MKATNPQKMIIRTMLLTAYSNLLRNELALEEEETATIDPTTVATTVPVDATYGDRIADVNAWVSSKSGVRHK